MKCFLGMLLLILVFGCRSPEHTRTIENVESFVLTTEGGEKIEVESGTASPDKMTIELRVYRP